MKRVGIIGGGPSGLTTAKSMLEQGLIPTVFEKGSHIGGVWRTCACGNAWDTMIMGCSKYFICFSDYPWDTNAALFGNTAQVCEYLQGYASHFSLDQHIKLNSKVIHVNELENGKWLVRWLFNDKIELEDQFDYLVIASGIYTNPYIPVTNGQDKFQGRIVHSKEYQRLKESIDLKNKRVITVGASCSGTDISADLALQDALVTNVFRQPHWYARRYIPFDPDNLNKLLPYDFVMFNRRMTHETPTFNSLDELCLFKNRFYANIFKEQNDLSNCDIHRYGESFEPPNTSISNRYLELIRDGKIQTKKSSIKKFDENGVFFADESYEAIDIVIWCTGYRLNLNFIHETVRHKLEYDENDGGLILYKNTFSSNYKNLAFVGILEENVYNIVELQGRWASLVFAGNLYFPHGNKFDENLNKQRLMKSSPLGQVYINEDYTAYSDELAEEIGVLPNLDEIRKVDERLFEMMWNGPACSAHYRLNDKHELAVKTITEAYHVKMNFLK